MLCLLEILETVSLWFNVSHVFRISVGDNVKAVSSDLTSLHHKAFDLLFV